MPDAQAPQPPAAGDGARRRPTLADAAARLQWRDFSLDRVLRLPCAAQALLTGAAAGLSAAAARFAVARRARSAGNWGVLAFAAGSLCSWEFCRFQRRVVAQQMQAMTAAQLKRDAGEQAQPPPPPTADEQKRLEAELEEAKQIEANRRKRWW